MFLEQLYKLRYLLLVEFSLLLVFAVFELVPFLILFSIFVIAAILLLSFKHPILAIHILIFSMIIDALIPVKGISKGPTVLIEEILLLLFVGLFTIKILLSINESNKIPIIILLWIPFLVWTLPTGLLVAVEKLRILIFWKNYFAGFFALILAYYAIKNAVHVRSLIIGLIIWGLLLALIEFKVLFDLGGFTSGIIGLYFKKNLLAITWGRSNYLASFFVLIIPITIGYFFYTKSKISKTFIAASLVFMAFAMILTLSRGGILALFIALVVLSFRILNIKTLIPFLSVSLIIIIVILLNPLTYVVINSISNLETSGSVYSRINFYEDTWNAFLKFPITGVGFGNLSYYATFILAKEASSSAHNIILGMLGEVGIVGGFFYFSILTAVITNIFKEFRRETNVALKLLKWSFFSAVIGAYFHSLVEPTFEGFQFSIIFWTVIGISLNLHLIRSNHLRKNILLSD